MGKTCVQYGGKKYYKLYIVLSDQPRGLVVSSPDY